MNCTQYVDSSRRSRRSTVIAVTAILALAPIARAADDDAAPIDFTRDIQPIFTAHCYKCHGPEKQKGGLRLDDGVSALRGGDSGKVITPGDADESDLVLRISGQDPEIIMPPKGDALSDEQVDLIARWIDAGAKWARGEDASVVERRRSDHWSFQPITRPPLPVVKQSDWVRNPIDRFILAKLEAEGIAPSAQADRYTLIRRVHLDLLGLLPTIEEVDAFVNDKRPDAYERMVDRALASPHYGERWGKHWLDGARYADSDGYSIDGARSMWPYRDWVINALNADMPFDQFTIEQLAGDLLDNPAEAQLIATGFHRNTHINQEGGTKADEFRVKALYDRVDTTGQVWLGLTIGCAQCHTHKFDPITQREYYAFYAFFNNAEDRNNRGPQLKLRPDDWDRRTAAARSRIAAAERALRDYDAAAKAGQAAWEKVLRRQAGADTDIQWSPLRVREAMAPGDAAFDSLDDGSLLVRGNLPPKGDYTITTETDADAVTAIRLDVLTHERLPKDGPGTAGNGNFVLSGVKVRIGERELKLAAAYAPHAQPNYPADHAIDGKDDTGWAINIGQGSRPGVKMNDNHAAYFIPAEPVKVNSGETITITLEHQCNADYYIGRFRLSATGASHVNVDSLAGVKLDPKLAEAVSTPADKRLDDQKKLLAAAFAKQDAQRAALAKAVEGAKKKLADMDKALPTTMVMRDAAGQRKANIHIRGDFLRPGDEVTPDVPQVLAPLTAKPDAANDAGRTRLDLARWIVSPDNPLTARVTMNRIWMRYFGRGMVETEEDFGTQGTPPSHPRLLDWLASEFIAQKWSMKAMHKLIVTSATYRQASRYRPELRNVDPGNVLLARQVRLRVDAEIVRDVALCAGGKLSATVGGPSVHPPQPDGVYDFTQNRKSWKTDTGPDRFRRGMYIFFYRSAPYPLLTTFNAPNMNTSCTRRVRSNTPLQSLTLANDETLFELAQALGARVLEARPAEAGRADEDKMRITHAFRLCMSRPPSARELERLGRFLDLQRERFASDEVAAKAVAGAEMPNDTPADEAAAWVALARAIMNLDEFITRE